MNYVALVTDPAGSFATVLRRPVPRLIEGGILVTTLATFDTQAEAKVFLRGLRGLDKQERERTPQEVEALKRLGITPAQGNPRSAQARAPRRQTPQACDTRDTVTNPGRRPRPLS